MIRAVTNYGEIRGKKKEEYLAFRGIPYAKPPVGRLRFRPPQEPEPWEGIRDCTKFGAPALQLFAASHVLQPNILEISSEDCLYLNVNTPAIKKVSNNSQDLVPDDTAALPVYVFLHGGAFETGGSNMPLYRGENFVNQGIVYVNINYRMSIFGFMALEEFRNESSVTGCFGIQDALQALKWVKENISAFGGDPENITVGGESAGAFITSALMGLREAQGLFQRCILESGSIVGLNSVARYGAGNPEIYLENSRRVAKDLGASDSAEGVKLLRRLPAQDLLKAWFFREDGSYRGTRTDPVLKGFLFDEDYAVDPRSQYINDVDLLFGFNTDEGTIFADKNLTPKDYENYLRKVYPELAGELMERYPVDQEHPPFVQCAEIIGLSAFKASMLPYADRLSESGRAVYGYHFDYLTERLRREGFGCRHIAELNFVFRKDLKYVGGDDEKGEEIASFMNDAWCNFIKTGKPAERWPRYDSSSPQVMRIGSEIRPEKMERLEELRYFEKILLENNPEK